MESRREFDERLDAYLDGGLDDAARAAFERDMESDPGLREAVEMQRRLAGALRRRFGEATGAPPRLSQDVRERRTRETSSSRWAIETAQRRRQVLKRSAIVAVLLLGLVGAWWSSLAAGWSSLVLLVMGEPRHGLDVTYGQVVSAGFVPSLACTTREQIVQYTTRQFGTPFTVRDTPGLEVLGWRHDPDLKRCGGEMLLCRVEGEPVIVYVGRAGNGGNGIRDTMDRASGLACFRKESDGLMFREVTPRSSARVLDQIEFVPAPPAEAAPCPDKAG